MMWKRHWFGRGIVLALLPFAAGGCHGRGHGHHGASDAELQEHVEERTEDVLDFVDADDAQVEAVKDVVRDATEDAKAFRAEHQTLRKQFQETLRAEQVDRAELEGLRVKALDLIDRASARMVVALADVADVLNADQRRKLVDKWKRHHR